jgi:predicted metal-dependent HD superfamily phosphohydrolase
VLLNPNFAKPQTVRRNLKKNTVLKETFIELFTKFTDDISMTNKFWTEIEEKYSDKKRYFHSLTHLDSLKNQLYEVKDKIKNWESILFTLYYHDIVYNSLKSDNEEKSAELAELRMKQIDVPIEIIANCKSQILATKTHQYNSDSDTNFFLDADLSILGQDIETYKVYFQNVREEYSIYPDLIYNTGRKKVLQHFLEMDRIFKTDYFYTKFEIQAKLNLQYELEYI